MNSTEGERSDLGRLFGTYAGGLARMAATGLGVFSAFCFYVTTFRGQLSFVEITLAASDLIVLVIVWCIGRRDKPGTHNGQLTSLTLWVFYLLLCVHLISPFARKYGEGAADPWLVLSMGLVVALPVLWDFLRVRMVATATKDIQDRLREKESHPSGAEEGDHRR